MNLSLRVSVLLGCLVAASGPVHAADGALRLGVMPFTSPGALQERYGELQAYIRRTLDTEVILETAPDFSSFKSRLGNRTYDIAVTPPHVAALAADHIGYSPILQSSKFAIELFAHKDGDLKTLEDLGGGVMALPDPLCFVSLLAAKRFADRDLSFHHTTSHSTALLLVAGKQADTTVSIQAFSDQLPSNSGDSLRGIAKLGDSFGVISVAPGAAAEDLQTRLTAAFLRFHESEEGQRFGLQFEPISEADLKGFIPFGSMLVERLSQTGQREP